MHVKLPNSNQTFSYYLPEAQLRSYISYYSFLNKASSSYSPLFIPDLGGAIIVSFGYRDINMLVWGPFKELTSIETRKINPLLQFFIEFQPGGLSRLLHPNCQELLNKKIDLADIDGSMYKALQEIFQAHLHHKGYTLQLEKSILYALDTYFCNLLDTRRDAFESNRSILNALRVLKTSDNMQTLSKEVNYSTRHIRRNLSAMTGVSGKDYMKIKRFNEAAKLLKESQLTIEEIADILSYYDAAHFVHDFSQLSGHTPATFRKNKSAFYNDTMKAF